MDVNTSSTTHLKYKLYVWETAQQQNEREVYHIWTYDVVLGSKATWEHLLINI